jgi:hypothetical protein
MSRAAQIRCWDPKLLWNPTCARPKIALGPNILHSIWCWVLPGAWAFMKQDLIALGPDSHTPRSKSKKTTMVGNASHLTIIQSPIRPCCHQDPTTLAMSFTVIQFGPSATRIQHLWTLCNHDSIAHAVTSADHSTRWLLPGVATRGAWAAPLGWLPKRQGSIALGCVPSARRLVPVVIFLSKNNF